MTAPNQKQENPKPGIKVEDILYALFRWKWLILVTSAAGVVAAAFLYFAIPTLYRSEAKLLVRYIRDTKAVEGVATDSQVRSPDTTGATIINSEVEILTSFDLLRQVAETIGPGKILGDKALASNGVAAASVILSNLKVEAPKQSNIIKVSFQHQDPQIAQSVLRTLIDAYLRKHVEVHRALGMIDEFLTQQVGEFRSRLSQTDEELRQQRKKLGVVLSVEDSKKAYADEFGKLRQDILVTETELEQVRAIQAAVEKAVPSMGQTNAANQVTPQEKIDWYKAISTELAASRARELELQLRYTDQSPLVLQVRRQIADLEILRKDLEAQNPSLATLPPINPAGSTSAVGSMSESTRVAFLESRLKVLNSQCEKLSDKVAALDEAGSTIRDLERRRDLAEVTHRMFAAGLEQARIDEALDPRQAPNISRVQEPSAARPSPTKRIKVVGGALAGGVLGGIGLALLLELVLDQSLRRAADLETRLRVPLCLSIPDLGTNGHARLFEREPKELPELTEAEDPTFDQSVQAWSPGQALRSYCDTLRDQLMVYFHLENLTHKPKLVGITSCGKSSGVTTIAAGVAQALSETGDGSVLLVELNLDQGLGLSRFCQGKPGCTLTEMLEGTALESAAGQKGLFVVSADKSNGKAMNLPLKLAGLMPRLKLSQLDYIVFDMPPVNLKSPTAKLAGMLDVTLLVIESGKTKRAEATRAFSSLRESKAHVLTVLNRSRSYVPRWLEDRLPSS